ncbi:MAG: hypothetical protein HY556_05975 [Euryarchaeota archaeon]|nr:hypothetical protein [Euryarchaeota archaeon]
MVTISMSAETRTRRESRIVDVCRRCGSDVERCHFCPDEARHFVSPPTDHVGDRDLYVCDRHIILLNVEDASFRKEVTERLGSAQWEIGMYAPTDGCECDRWA